MTYLFEHSLLEQALFLGCHDKVVSVIFVVDNVFQVNVCVRFQILEGRRRKRGEEGEEGREEKGREGRRKRGEEGEEGGRGEKGGGRKEEKGEKGGEEGGREDGKWGGRRGRGSSKLTGEGEESKSH